MARKAALKVYRTPIGFHDAYVAAPSQKAALALWGSDANLFARGAAELVTDPALTREPLADPGTVIKRSRGSIEQQLAALPPDRHASTTGTATPPKRAKHPAKVMPPRPSRHELEEAERELAALLERQAAQAADLSAREREIARERHDLERTHARDRAEMEKAVDRARDAHAKAVGRWIERS